MTTKGMPNEHEKAEVNTEATALMDDILAMLNRSHLPGRWLEIHAHVFALIGALASVLGSIKCKGCRRRMREHIEEILAESLDRAMDQPAGEQQHVH